MICSFVPCQLLHSILVSSVAVLPLRAERIDNYVIVEKQRNYSLMCTLVRFRFENSVALLIFDHYDFQLKSKKKMYFAIT
jgi:hypothetical protein